MASAPGDRREVAVSIAVVADAAPGEHIALVGAAPELGLWQVDQGVRLKASADSPRVWTTLLRVPTNAGAFSAYKFVRVGGVGVTWEPCPNRSTPVSRDTWLVAHFGQGAAASGAQRAPSRPPRELDCTVVWEVTCSATRLGDVLCVVGPHSEFGSGDVSRGLRLSTSTATFPRWHGAARLARGQAPLTFRLAIARADGSCTWERGGERTLKLPAEQDDDRVVLVSGSFAGEGLPAGPSTAEGARAVGADPRGASAAAKVGPGAGGAAAAVKADAGVSLAAALATDAEPGDPAAARAEADRPECGTTATAQAAGGPAAAATATASAGVGLAAALATDAEPGDPAAARAEADRPECGTAAAAQAACDVGAAARPDADFAAAAKAARIGLAGPLVDDDDAARATAPEEVGEGKRSAGSDAEAASRPAADPELGSGAGASLAAGAIPPATAPPEADLADAGKAPAAPRRIGSDTTVAETPGRSSPAGLCPSVDDDAGSMEWVRSMSLTQLPPVVDTQLLDQVMEHTKQKLWGGGHRVGSAERKEDEQGPPLSAIDPAAALVAEELVEIAAAVLRSGHAAEHSHSLAPRGPPPAPLQQQPALAETCAEEALAMKDAPKEQKKLMVPSAGESTHQVIAELLRAARLSAAAAAGGAVVVGAGGATAGLVLGGTGGAVLGLLPALFTFGLSVPAGAVIGGSLGAAAGAAAGGAAGAAGGGAAGFAWARLRRRRAVAASAEKPAAAGGVGKGSECGKVEVSGLTLLRGGGWRVPFMARRELEGKAAKEEG